MHHASHNLLTRPDTFFGVCEGLGEDLRIHANILRLALAGILFWNPFVAIGAYAAMAVLVLLSRWMFPSPRVGVDTAARSEPAASAQAAAEPAEEVVEPVLLAA
ncbi:MAG TPA: PspC domain-containing protein [Allosphingosinicella sp.]|jgi:phage shock protein PspC (stress-responsive transcriptional regulator)